MNTAYIPTTDE